MSPDMLQICLYQSFELLTQTWMFCSNSVAGDVNFQHKVRNQTDGKLLLFKLPLSLVKLTSAYSLNLLN